MFQLRISIALGNAHLTENYRAEVALTYHHRHCCVHQSAVTQEDKRFVLLYSLQPSKRIALKTVENHIKNIIEVSSHNIHLVYIYHSWYFVIISLTPNGFSLRFNTALSTKNCYRTVENSK